jgi:isoaspartyl peptidase/L-asparaginase-like protein (Ntn-hydrolase superfamily)
MPAPPHPAPDRASISSASARRTSCRRESAWPGQTVGEAGAGVIGDIGALGGIGGLISVDGQGRGGWCFNSQGMYRGLARADQPHIVAMYGED